MRWDPCPPLAAACRRDFQLMPGMNVSMIRPHRHWTNSEFYDLGGRKLRAGLAGLPRCPVSARPRLSAPRGAVLRRPYPSRPQPPLGGLVGHQRRRKRQVEPGGRHPALPRHRYLAFGDRGCGRFQSRSKQSPRNRKKKPLTAADELRIRSRPVASWGDIPVRPVGGNDSATAFPGSGLDWDLEGPDERVQAKNGQVIGAGRERVLEAETVLWNPSIMGRWPMRDLLTVTC